MTRWHLRSGGASGSDVQWVDVVYTFLGADRVSAVDIHSFPGHNCLMGCAPNARRVFTTAPEKRAAHHDLVRRAISRTLSQQALIGRGTFAEKFIMRDAALASQPCDILLVCGRLSKSAAAKGGVSATLVRDCLGGTGHTLKMVAEFHAERWIALCFVEAATGRCWVGALYRKRVEGLHELKSPEHKRLADVLDVVRDQDDDTDIHVTMIGTRDLPSSAFIESVFTDSWGRPSRAPTG